ncbi:MAG: hypothetical protein IPJ65_15525 [Archangiaceae bacterium]|nr:hypothetical protein [Archangiaceae bacterium]
MTELSLFVVGVLGVVFGVSSFTKVWRLRGYLAFRASLQVLPLHPLLRSGPMAAALVVGECTTVLLLIAAPSLGGAAAMLMLAAFTAVIQLVRTRAPGQVRCRCFGAGAAPLGTSQLVRNSVLLGLASLLFASGLFPRPPTGHVHTLLLGLVAGALLTRWDDLWALLAPAQPHPSLPGA